MITFSTSSQAVRRTGTQSNKIDYILLLLTLGATVSAVGEQRRGVSTPRAFRTSRDRKCGRVVA